MLDQSRIAQIDDLDEVASLYQAICDYQNQDKYGAEWTWGDYPSRDGLAQFIEHSLVVVGYQDQQLIAAAVITTGDDYPQVEWAHQVPDAKIGVVHLLGVHPDFRGTGAATGIVQAVLKFAKEAGYQVLHLDVLGDNVPAMKLYQKQGFVPVETLTLHYDDLGDRSATVMEYQLTNWKESTMKEKVGQVFSIAKDNQLVAGCTISKEVTQGDHQVTYFSLAAGTDISAEIFPYYKLVLVSDGQVNIYGQDSLDQLVATGDGIVTPINTPVGFRTASGAVYTEILVQPTDKLNVVLEIGKPFKLADLVPYQTDKIINMDLVQSDQLKFVIMSFDQETGLAEHAAPGNAMIFALDGQGIITYEDQDHDIQAGENFHFAKGGRHAVKANGPFKMALLIDLV